MKKQLIAAALVTAIAITPAVSVAEACTYLAEPDYTTFAYNCTYEYKHGKLAEKYFKMVEKYLDVWATCAHKHHKASKCKWSMKYWKYYKKYERQEHLIAKHELKCKYCE